MAITFGTENIFESAVIVMTRVAWLDSTHFVAVYIETSNARGTAVIGVVSGTGITSYGTPVTFLNATINDIDVAVLDSTHFVVVFRDVTASQVGTAIVGVTSGTTISSYGSESEFESTAVNGISAGALSSTEFVVAYDDGDASGDARIGTVSGTTISGYGDEVAFNSVSTDSISLAALDTTDFVIVFKDTGGDNFGIGIMGSNAPPGPAFASINGGATGGIATINGVDISNIASVNQQV